MHGDDFGRSIRQAWSLVYDELGVARTASSLHSLPTRKEFNAVALDQTTTYAQIYTTAVSLSYYNIMLDDYSIFQFSYRSPEEWRLAYLPNPWLAGVETNKKTVSEWEELEANGLLDAEALTNLMSELPYHGAVPQIRFELSISQYREISHPAAHFHVGRHTENRWALARPLTPLAFTMYIMRLYYSASWNLKSSFFVEQPHSVCLEQRFIGELNRSSVVHQFTNTEKQSLHLSSQ